MFLLLAFAVAATYLVLRVVVTLAVAAVRLTFYREFLSDRLP